MIKSFLILSAVLFIQSCTVNDSSEAINLPSSTLSSLVSISSSNTPIQLSSEQLVSSSDVIQVSSTKNDVSSEIDVQISSSINPSSSSINISEIESTCTKYSRELYASWYDADKNCQDTRQEVLNEENLDGQSDDCKIVNGRWYDPYSDSTFTDPSKLDIDHFVPLAEAHRSGAYAWSQEQRKAFSNSLERPSDLIAVWNSQNRSKGDRDISKWLPMNEEYHKNYVKTWVDVKSHWGLYADSEELEAIRRILGSDTVGMVFPMELEEVECVSKVQ